VPQQRKINREIVWAARVQARHPMFGAKADYLSTNQQLALLYEDLKKKGLETQDVNIRVLQLKIEGSGAQDALAEIERLAQLAEKKATQTDFVAPDVFIKEILDPQAHSFANARLEMKPLVLTQKATESQGAQAPNPCDPEKALIPALLEAVSSRPILPRVVVEGLAQPMIYFVQGIEPGPSSLIPPSDPRVDRMLRQMIYAAQQGVAMRETAYHFFGKNRLVVENYKGERIDGEQVQERFFSVDPRSMAEALLPEDLLPGAPLSVSSTLGHPELEPRIRGFVTRFLEQVMSLPNP
jgi:hypothetical protein